MTDREWADKLAEGDSSAWDKVFKEVVSAELKSPKIRQMLLKYSLSEHDLVGMLFEEMIGRQKISLYRGEGSLAGWLRKYIRGFVFSADPRKHGELSIEGIASLNEESNQTSLDIPVDDNGVFRNEVWAITHRCFRELWAEDPERAYIHLLKTRFFLTSEEVKDFLEVSTAANVDQIFSRNIKFMRAAWPEKGE